VALAANANGIRDLAGNQSSFSSTAVVDKAGPVAADVQAVNGTGTAGRIDSGDVVTYTFSESMSAGSIKSGWSGAALAVTVALGSNGTNDTVSVSTAGVNLGTVGTGANYVGGNRSVNATIALSGATLTLTLHEHRAARAAQHDRQQHDGLDPLHLGGGSGRKCDGSDGSNAVRRAEAQLLGRRPGQT
jgi:hypothetical protein